MNDLFTIKIRDTMAVHLREKALRGDVDNLTNCIVCLIVNVVDQYLFH